LSAPFQLARFCPGFADIAPVPLSDRPTPVRAEPGLARALGLGALLVKREDLSSRVYGGAKVRNLEFLLGAAERAGARGVVTLGAAGSHHVLTTAIFARARGLAVRAVLFPQPSTREVEENARILPALGVEVWCLRSLLAVPWAWWRARRRPLGGALPHVIAPGGTSPLGVLGAAEAFLEVVTLLEAGEVPRPECVVVPAGSGGTLAGILAGRALVASDLEVIGVRVVPRVVVGPLRVRRQARRALALLEALGAPALVPAAPGWISDAAGPGYARPTDEADRWTRVTQAEAGFRAETTYTGKALAALARPALRGRRVLFWNTFSAVDPVLPTVPHRIRGA
jgi:D-cysteine desulfhydrase